MLELLASRPGGAPFHAAILSLAIVLAAGFGCGSPDSAGDAAGGATGAATAGGTSDTCALLSQSEVAAAVGNHVEAGQPYAGPEVCRWDTANPDDVSVLLTVRLSGSVREQVLCRTLRESSGNAAGFEGLADVASWKYSEMPGMFNSGDYEGCGPKGFVSLSLNGKADEARLKQATTTLLRTVLQRL